MTNKTRGHFIGLTKVRFPDITVVVLKKHNKENYTQNRLRHKATSKLSNVLITLVTEIYACRLLFHCQTSDESNAIWACSDGNLLLVRLSHTKVLPKLHYPH